MRTSPRGEKRPGSVASAAVRVGQIAAGEVRDTYQNDPQALHRTVFEADNLDILRAMNSESVDLIYLDPPFNSKEDYSAPIGSEAAGAAFKDTWTLSDVDLLEHNRLKFHAMDKRRETLYALIYAAGKAHSKGMFSYLMMMAPRLFELRRVLKSTGSIYLHCDPTASQYLKVVMDAIFGASNFRNEIVWRRATAHNDPGRYGNNTDRLLYYVASKDATWNTVRVPKTGEQLKTAYPSKDDRGAYRPDNLTGPSHGQTGGESAQPWKGYDVLARGRVWSAPLKGEYAKWIERNVIPGYRTIKGVHARLNALDSAGMIHHPKKGTTGWPGLKRYEQADSGNPVQALFLDISGFTNFNKGPDFTGYPTQKPLPLLERIIRASSKEGDLVLDPFCGCATTMVAAEMLDRKWVGIDLSSKAAELVVSRIQRRRNLFQFQDIRARTDLPIRTDVERRIVKDYSKEWRALKAKLYEEQKGCCNFCHIHFRPGNLEMDHIFPKAKGGKNWVDNYQLLCSECNGVKHDEVSNEKARARIAARRGIDFSPFEIGSLASAYRHPEAAMPKVAEESKPYGSKKRKPKT